MTEKRDRERDGPLPAPRDADTPARAPAEASYATHPQFSRGAPAPEYLSLTYTLPYHLLVRADEIAQASYRSQSEVLAEALRLYVRIWKARRKHTRISTVDGFSYQEVEIAEALFEEEIQPENVDGNGNGHGADHATAGHSPAATADVEEVEEPDATSVEPESATPEPVTEPERDDDDTDAAAAADAPDRAAGAGTDADAHAAAGTRETEEGERPAAGPDRDATARTDADAVGGDFETAAGPADAHIEDTPAAPEADASEATPKSESTAPPVAAQKSATVATDDEDIDEELHEIADPAASVRQELEAVCSEPLHSLRLQRTLEKIVARIDVKDHSPEDHSATVSEMARKLARIRGLQGKELLYIQLAGLVHDIGKASIPDHILAKRRPSPEEMAMIRKYPEFGAELLRIVPSLEPIARLVSSHQERWNGNGYPDGLQGTDIPVECQIVALCDVYQVLIHDRHYRPAYTEERALQIIRQNVGTLWNPEIARAFLKLITNGDEDEE